MIKIDAHQHFWKYEPIRDSWITDEMELLKKDWLPEDLAPILNANGIEGCVVVQSDQSEDENNFQLSNAEKYPFIKGVVGWVDLAADNVEDRLNYYSQFSKIKGFRHVLQGEPQRDFMLRPDFLNGISLLQQYNFTYDILVYPDQLKYVQEMVARFPGQKFVLDHMAKPNIKDKKPGDWTADLIGLAEFENVSCKISGLVTEASWHQWTLDDFEYYIYVVLQSFGIERVMFGSDWPVCNLSATYEEVYGIVSEYFSGYTINEQNQIFGENSVKFYNLWQ